MAKLIQEAIGVYCDRSGFIPKAHCLKCGFREGKACTDESTISEAEKAVVKELIGRWD